jgi:parallel beta-helix repeat protein
MARLFPSASIDSSDRRDLLNGWNAPRRPRNRMTPGAESLEVRICLSAIMPSSGTDRSAHVSPVTHGESHQAPRVEQVRHLVTSTAIPFKKKAPKSPPPVHVNPGAKSGAKSLATALKRAKPGETIVLAPGTYTQNVVISNKNNLTIVGAANQSSIFAPASGDAIKVILSSNITIENVWFRSQGSQGRGLLVEGSSLTVQNIKTDGTLGDGALVVEDQGQAAKLTATSSQFDSVQTGYGLELEQGASATINGCTFNNNGTASSDNHASVGLFVGGGATANVLNSQFIGNASAGLFAYQNSQVTAQGSTFSDNQQDGALFANQATANLVDNTFASNGVTRGGGTGFNGVEFFTSFTGTAVVTGNLFQNNTASGVYIGSAPNNIQIGNNTFDNNVVGVSLDASAAPVSATVQGNTFVVPIGSPDTDVGLLAMGSGVTATIGGDDALANTFENYVNGHFIIQSNGFNDTNLGNGNTFLSAGVAVPPSEAISTLP